MAAIRQRQINVMTGWTIERAETAWRMRRKRERRRVGRPKTVFKRKRRFEVVATKWREVETGLFKPVGELFVFKPRDSEAYLWDRIRHMGMEGYEPVWNEPMIGVRAALRKLKVDYPKKFHRVPYELLNWTVTEYITPRIDPVTKRPMGEREELVKYPYEGFVRDRWIPRFVYQTEDGANGLFSSWKQAIGVSRIYGIDVYQTAMATDWIRSETPDIAAEVERMTEVTEQAYQDFKQTIVSQIEARWEEGLPIEPDWALAKRGYREQFGPKTDAIIERLRTELAPIIRGLELRDPPFRENRPFQGRRRAISRSFRPALYGEHTL